MYGAESKKMTKAITEIQDRRKSAVLAALSAVYLFATVLSGILLSGEMSELVRDGMELAVRSVIPSSFPFMVISDLYVSYGYPERITCLRRLASRVFGLPTAALGALVCGNVGGFPIGAKITAELYRRGEIDRESAQRLIALSSNPSVAFVVGAVGLGMYSDMRVGIVLLLSLYISSCVCGFLTKRKRADFSFNANNTRQNYSFVASVKSAGAGCIGVISFVSLFSVVVGLIKNHLQFKPLAYLIIAFCEVTNAAKIFSDPTLFSPVISLALTAFSLGFGGVSVLMQNAIFTEGSGLGMKKYALIKLMQGVVCSAVVTLLSLALI